MRDQITDFVYFILTNDKYSNTDKIEYLIKLKDIIISIINNEKEG